jgi:hypothetical protein
VFEKVGGAAMSNEKLTMEAARVQVLKKCIRLTRKIVGQAANSEQRIHMETIRGRLTDAECLRWAALLEDDHRKVLLTYPLCFTGSTKQEASDTGGTALQKINHPAQTYLLNKSSPTMEAHRHQNSGGSGVWTMSQLT